MGVSMCKVNPHDKPDVIVLVEDESCDGDHKIGIEVRRHFNDETQHKFFKGSKGQQIVNFWQGVQKETEILRKNYPQLSDIHARFRLNTSELSKRSLRTPFIRKFASEIVSFVAKESGTGCSDIIIIPDWKERTFTRFPGHPLMQKYVVKVIIRKGFNAQWDANISAGGLGIDTQRLSEIIQDKSKKAKQYDRHNLDQLWLLIAAPHENVFNAMHDFPEQINFDEQEIFGACVDTPFNKIFFWSSAPHEWFKQIWPKNFIYH